MDRPQLLAKVDAESTSRSSEGNLWPVSAGRISEEW
jgi:hypothetical protein